MNKGFSRVTGGRALSFRDLSVGEALASRLEEAERTAEGASFPRR